MGGGCHVQEGSEKGHTGPGHDQQGVQVESLDLMQWVVRRHWEIGIGQINGAAGLGQSEGERGQGVDAVLFQ